MSVTRSTAPWTSACRTAWRSSAFALLASVSLLVLVPAPYVDASAANAFREDETRPSLPRELALSGSASHDGAAFVVPRVIG